MTQNSNQFNITQEKGALTYAPNFNVFSCRVYASETTALVPGQPVKLVDVSGALPTVTAITAITDEVFGYVTFNTRTDSYAATTMVKILGNDGVLVMEAGAAIAAGATIENVITGEKVQTQATGAASGIALDKAAADGDLIRVLIKAPKVLPVFTAKSVAQYSAGAGALPIVQDVLMLETGGAEALTLADGVIGQELIIIMEVDGGDGTLTPANYGNGTTLTFDDVGDSVHLVFDGTNWYNVGTPTATVA